MHHPLRMKARGAPHVARTRPVARPVADTREDPRCPRPGDAECRCQRCSPRCRARAGRGGDRSSRTAQRPARARRRAPWMARPRGRADGPLDVDAGPVVAGGAPGGAARCRGAGGAGGPGDDDRRVVSAVFPGRLGEAARAIVVARRVGTVRSSPGRSSRRRADLVALVALGAAVITSTGSLSAPSGRCSRSAPRWPWSG